MLGANFRARRLNRTEADFWRRIGSTLEQPRAVTNVTLVSAGGIRVSTGYVQGSLERVFQ